MNDSRESDFEQNQFIDKFYIFLLGSFKFSSSLQPFIYLLCFSSVYVLKLFNLFITFPYVFFSRLLFLDRWFSFEWKFRICNCLRKFNGLAVDHRLLNRNAVFVDKNVLVSRKAMCVVQIHLKTQISTFFS